MSPCSHAQLCCWNPGYWLWLAFAVSHTSLVLRGIHRRWKLLPALPVLAWVQSGDQNPLMTRNATSFYGAGVGWGSTGLKYRAVLGRGSLQFSGTEQSGFLKALGTHILEAKLGGRALWTNHSFYRLSTRLVLNILTGWPHNGKTSRRTVISCIFLWPNFRDQNLQFLCLSLQ